MRINSSQFAIMLHSVPHLGPKGIARLLRELPRPLDKLDLRDFAFWNVSAHTLRKSYGLHPVAAECIAERKEHLLDASSKIAAAIDRLGIKVFTVNDLDYPICMREYESEPPPIIYAYGNISMLNEKKFAVVSSNKISARHSELLREFAGLLADWGLVAVTSHNTRPYQIVGLAAKSQNAPICLVLDRGILTAFPQGLGWEPVAQARIWDLRFNPEKDLVISKFRLYDPWIGANGRERDRMVFALSDVVVAVELRSGGVMESECLRALNKGREVYIYTAEDCSPSSNQVLLNSGARSIKRDWAHSLLAALDFHNVQNLDESFMES